MLDLRSPLILGAAPAGVVLGAAAWFVAGGGSSSADEVAALDARLVALQTRPAVLAKASFDPAAQLAHSPLFALASPGAAPQDIALRLDGLVRSSRRIAALISIGGKPADWLALGETRDEVTLTDVQSSKVVVDTPNGARDVPLGVGPGAGPAGPAQAGLAPPLSAPSAPPPGFRLPPAPASAPAVGG